MNKRRFFFAASDSFLCLLTGNKLCRSDQRRIGCNVTLPLLLFDCRRAGAVVLAAGTCEVVVMTEAVFKRRFTYGDIVGEVIVEGVSDAHLSGVLREALADQILENQGGGQGRTAEQLRDLADEDLAAEICFDVILRRLCSALPAALAADNRLLLFCTAARQQYPQHF